MNFALLALMLVPARAGKLEAPKTLAPLLLGSLASASSPIVKGMDGLARQISSLPAAAAGAHLLPLASASAHPAARAAALALAHAVVERRGLETLPPAVQNAAAALTSGSPYRGEGAAADETLQLLSEEAAEDPSLTSLFEGRPQDPYLGLSAAFMDEGAIVSEGWSKRGPLRKGTRTTLYEHAMVPGAVVEVYHGPIEASLWNPQVKLSPAYAAAQADFALARRLAELGAGPRVFGVQLIPEGTVKPATHVVVVKEAVYGKTVADLIDARAFGEAEMALVNELLWKLARARLMPDGLSPRRIMIGVTAVDAVPRAYLLRVDGLHEASSKAHENGLRETLQHAPVTDTRVAVYSHGVYQGLLRGKKSLASLLNEGLWRGRRSGFWRRLGDAMEGALDSLGRVPPR